MRERAAARERASAKPAVGGTSSKRQLVEGGGPVLQNPFSWNIKFHGVWGVDVESAVGRGLSKEVAHHNMFVNATQ